MGGGVGGSSVVKVLAKQMAGQESASPENHGIADLTCLFICNSSRSGMRKGTPEQAPSKTSHIPEL